MMHCIHPRERGHVFIPSKITMGTPSFELESRAIALDIRTIKRTAIHDPNLVTYSETSLRTECLPGRYLLLLRLHPKAGELLRGLHRIVHLPDASRRYNSSFLSSSSRRSRYLPLNTLRGFARDSVNYHPGISKEYSTASRRRLRLRQAATPHGRSPSHPDPCRPCRRQGRSYEARLHERHHLQAAHPTGGTAFWFFRLLAPFRILFLLLPFSCDVLDLATFSSCFAVSIFIFPRSSLNFDSIST